ncbi:hypothetical protein ACFO5O_05580 [Geojedonia litorea]|uniref:Uncharacterized protein n=1 Tax=Geojedonia litorea TaxID=1268269 RepID=A0ABV9N2X3_9FLAO
MRILSFLLFISSFSFAQSQNSANLLIDRAPCTFEMTVEQLTSKKLNFKCEELFGNDSFGIENFRIKFRGKASIPVEGNTLNADSNILAKKLKAGDYVTIFHVENLIVDGNKSQEYKTLHIKIIEP